MCDSAHPTGHARAVLLANFVTEEEGQEALQYWAAYLGLNVYRSWSFIHRAALQTHSKFVVPRI